MLRSLFSGISGLRSHQTMLDVTGNNIANVNTTGFKSSQTQFQDTLSQVLQNAGGAQQGTGGTNPAQVGLGVRVAGITTNFTQGASQITGRSTDMMIQGDGFFMVRKGNDQFYTRAGSFDFDAVEAVAGTEPLERHQVLDLLTLLVDKSLVTTIDADAGTRYRLLETVRDYALGELERHGEVETLRHRHRDHYVRLVTETFWAMTRMEVTWSKQVDEVDNARIAFQFSRRCGDATEALQLASFMLPTWLNTGRSREGWSWVEG